MDSAENKLSVTIENTHRPLTPIPSSNLPLKTMNDVRVEMAKVYRDMKSGLMDVSEGTKLIYALSQIAKLIEVSELEARIELIHRTISTERNQA